MKFSLLAIASAFLVGLNAGGTAPDITEPARGFLLTVDGNTHEIELGDRFEITVGERALPCSLAVRPTRHFEGYGLEFEYPGSFSFELDDESPEVQFVSLEGPDTLLMLQVYSAGLIEGAFSEMNPEQFLDMIVESMCEEFGEGNFRIEPSTKSLGSVDLASRKVFVSLAGYSFCQELVAMDVRGARIIFSMQGSLDENEILDSVSTGAIELLARTFALTD